MSEVTDHFIAEINAGCISLWKLHGIIPSVACAQAALESGWGTSSLSKKYNNLFGIKGTKGDSTTVNLPTTEYYDGSTPIKIIDTFRVYPSWSVSILDYGRFISTNRRYTDALYMTDPIKQIETIYKGGYATDPHYVEKIISIVENFDLRRLDEILNIDDKGTYIIPDYDGYSIVDGLKMSGVTKPDFLYRAKVALKNNIIMNEGKYIGSTKQNHMLLEMLRNGTLKKI